MCGFVGCANFYEANTSWFLEALSSLQHRGPDSAGIWQEQSSGVILGHRRLAILDLSPRGHQPMVSSNKRFCLVYNGEIYNFRILRKQLEEEGYSFRSESDTELILAAIEKWGVAQAVSLFVGMFAFALWDQQEKVISLVRDRLGIKPLYYGEVGKNFFFSSELQAFYSHPEFRAEVDPNSLALYFQYSYVPTPLSIYQKIKKLPPASILQFSTQKNTVLDISSYWSLEEIVKNGLTYPIEDTGKDLEKKVERVITQSIQDRLLSDVPVGAFLSGGIDSSLVVALMQKLSSCPVQTFTLGFDSAQYDEAQYARSIAEHLGTDHHELYLSAHDIFPLIERLPEIYDEPFADSSQIPTLLISQLARQNVTVALSGDGGDEVFAGYNRHIWGQKIYQNLERVPRVFRKAFAYFLTQIPPSLWDTFLFSNHQSGRKAGEKIHKLARILPASSPMEMYQALVSRFPFTKELGYLPADESIFIEKLSPTLQMMYQDSLTYLPDDILTKVDRASMSCSLEVRVPFLDHRVVELAWGIPLSFKVRKKQGKWILRQILQQYVPSALFERPKMGFALPLGFWLRTGLRDWAESLINSSLLQSHPLLEKKVVDQFWQEHLSGKKNWQDELWNILLYLSWEEKRRAQNFSQPESISIVRQKS